ncbi:MAG: putative Ig domain-containing protein [Planctomycetota bacterium]|nr:putative Ig domain-containing protein [Planctomycetota bacterium]
MQMSKRASKNMRGRLLACAACLILRAEFGFAAYSAATQPDSPDRLAAIRTPDAPTTPRINGARIFGAHSGHPFIYHVAATGDRPITFTADGLPAGLSIDAATGNITGRTTEKGEHKVVLTAANAKGKDSANFTIVIGDTICLTPPLGWNSWNFFGPHIDEAKIKGAGDAMVATGLINHGWTYINMDDTWEGQRDADGRIQTSSGFPDLKALSDYIHSQGLKFGIYSSPGPKTCARAVATYQHEDQDAQSYADWGVDYVKYDWCSYGDIASKITLAKYGELLPSEDAAQLKTLTDQRGAIPRRNRTPEQNAQMTEITNKINAINAKLDPEKKKEIDLEILQAPYQKFHESLEKVDRDIIYSLCQYGMGNVSAWGDKVGGNLWRTTGDISANWRSMSGIGFRQNELAQYASPGHWNDPDMLEVGNGSLTPDECYTHMTLWSILSAPLLIGCEMPKMDKLTVSMFSNDEVLAVDQDSLGKQGYRLKQDGTSEVWVKPLADGSLAVALFNRGAEAATISASWLDLKLQGPQTVRDLWREKDLPGGGQGVEAQVNSHGAELFKASPVAKAN